MTIPKKQFYLYAVKRIDPYYESLNGFLYQTFEEALQYCCKDARAHEVIDTNSPFCTEIYINFNDSDNKYVIYPLLFTYKEDKPLVTHLPSDDEKEIEMRKVN